MSLALAARTPLATWLRTVWRTEGALLKQADDRWDKRKWWQSTGDSLEEFAVKESLDLEYSYSARKGRGGLF